MATKNFSGILSRKQEVNSNAVPSSRVINNGSTITAVNDDGTLTVIAQQKQVDVHIGKDGTFREVEREVTPKADPRDIIRQAARRRAAARTPKEASASKEADQMRQVAQDVTPEPAAPKAAAPKQEPVPKQESAAPKAAVRKATPKKQAAAQKPEATKPATPKAAAPKQEPAPAKPRYTLMQYSEKCVALFGDTKSIKDELRKIGGRYNPNLHPFGPDTSVPGWVFPNKYREDVEQLINKK